MNNALVKSFITYLVKQLSIIPNGKLVSICNTNDNEEQMANMIDGLILLIKLTLDEIMSNYPESDKEYSFVYSVICKILCIFGMVSDEMELPKIRTISISGLAITFVPESLTNINMFSLLRGAAWVNNRLPSSEIVGMIHISPNDKYNIKSFVTKLPMKYRVLRNIAEEIQQYLGYEHCTIEYPNSTHLGLIPCAIEIRKHHTSVVLADPKKVLTSVENLTIASKYKYDTQVLYLTIWIMNLIYYRYGNEELADCIYINAAHDLAKSIVPKKDINCIPICITTSIIFAVLVLVFCLSYLLWYVIN